METNYKGEGKAKMKRLTATLCFPYLSIMLRAVAGFLDTIAVNKSNAVVNKLGFPVCSEDV